MVGELAPVSLLLSGSWHRVGMSIKRLGILLLIQLIIYGICVALFAGLLFTAGLGMVLSQIVSTHSLTFAHFNSSIFVIGSVIILLLWIVCSVLVHIATIRILQSAGQVSLTKIFGQSLGILPAFILLQLLYVFFVFGGFSFFVIPGFFMLFFLSFATYGVVCDGYTPLGALKRSMSLVAAYPMLIVIRFVVLLVILSLPGMFSAQFDSNNMTLFFALCVPQIVIGWFGIAYMYELYSDVSKRVSATKQGNVLWFFLTAVLGWMLAIYISFAMYRFINSGNMQKFLRAEMYQENRAQYRIRPGANIQFSPRIQLKES